MLEDAVWVMVILDDDSLFVYDWVIGFMIFGVVYDSLWLWELIDELYELVAIVGWFEFEFVMWVVLVVNFVIIWVEWVFGLVEVGDDEGVAHQLVCVWIVFGLVWCI